MLSVLPSTVSSLVTCLGRNCASPNTPLSNIKTGAVQVQWGKCALWSVYMRYKRFCKYNTVISPPGHAHGAERWYTPLGPRLKHPSRPVHLPPSCRHARHGCSTAACTKLVAFVTHAQCLKRMKGVCLARAGSLVVINAPDTTRTYNSYGCG